MALPSVSYIIITMNRQDELAGCLSSVRAQDYPHKQIIVVDNGSSDDTAKMVREQFPEVELLVLSSNQGVAGGRNRGIEIARGEFCIFLDDDAQFVSPQTTQRALAYFQDDAVLTCIAFFIRNASTGLEDRKAIPRTDKRSIPEDYSCSYFCGAGFAVKRQIFEKLGMFWERLTYGGEDLDFSYRLLDNGYRLLRAVSVEVIHHEARHSRPEGQWVYANARNRCWIAAKNLPWIYAFSTMVLWWVYTALIGLKRRQFRFFIRGLREAVIGLPSVLCERKPIGKTALQTLKALSGRRWY